MTIYPDPDSSKYYIVSIGNGVYARSRRPLSLLEGYRKLQATCGHVQRDAQGTCYRCGKRVEVVKREQRSVGE